MSLEITVGCDPEFFVQSKKDKKLLSAHGMIKGTKAHPFKVKDGAVQVDGNALELNINPAHTKEEFVGNIQSVFAQMSAMVPEMDILGDVSAVTFDKDYFDALPDEARELGCDPDWNAYSESKNAIPKLPNKYLRAAGGHVHLGWLKKNVDISDPNHFDDCVMMTKQLDWYLGLWSLSFDHDNTRRQLYGKAGAFRIKPYGMEYRVLSNQWLRSPELMGWVFDATKKAADDLYAGKYIEDTLRGRYRDNAQFYIDNMGSRTPEYRRIGYIESVKELVKYTGLSMPPGGEW